MDIYSQHFENVKKEVAKLKMPSKLRLLIPSSIVLLGVISFILSIMFFLIAMISWIVQLNPDFLFTIAKYSFLFGLIAPVLSIFSLKSYFKSINNFKNTEVLRKDFKLNILPKIISEEYKDVYYKFDGVIEEKHILDADFFSSDILNSLKNRWFFGDDYFSGKIENVDFEFCELYYKTEGLTKLGCGVVIAIALIPIFLFLDDDFDLPSFGGDDDSDVSFFDSDDEDYDDSSRRNGSQARNNKKVNEKAFLYGTKTNFKGFFLYADFHKDFNGEVRIRTKKKFQFSKLFNFSSKGLKKVKPENKTIDKKYLIEASDLQMGYYVLSPAIINAIEELNSRLGSSLSLTLKNGKLFLIAPMNKDFFENITITNDSIKVNTIEDIKKDLLVIRDLLLEFNLNNRIWLKA